MTAAYSDSILAATPDGILSIDARSIILAANPAAERLLGYGPGELLGLPLPETIIPPELAEQHRRGMDRFLASGKGPVIGARVEITALHRSGARIPVELCVFLDSERPREVVHAVLRDISERIRRTEAREAERGRLQQFLDATSDAWWDARVGGETAYGASFHAIVGRADGSIAAVEPPVQDWVHEDDRRRAREAWDAHVSGAKARYECTYRIVAADGSLRWLRDRGRAVEFSVGRPTRIVGTTTDVTEQQSADERLRNAQRLEMLGLLAGGFAHDLNNLLAAIRGQAALAATEPGIVPAAIESLEAIQLATTKAKLLTSNMLALGKPQRERIERFVARNAIEETLQIVRPGLPRSIAILVELDPIDGVEVEMDPSAMQQMLLNLVLNARDAMPQGGRLRISAFHDAEARDGSAGVIEIVVEDSGVGISAEVQARIFEPFFTTKPKGIGTGLGLAVVQQAVAGAGGTIAVGSDVGRGTRFVIRIPAVGVARGERASAASTRSMRLLVIERDHFLRTMLVEALRAEDHEVLATGDMAEAQRWLLDAGRPLDALVLDVHPPAVEGAALHARAEAARGHPLAAIFMATEPSGADSGGGRTVSLTKPFEIGELLTALSRAAVAAGRV
jgi:PAS domain S-box-containing protein